MTAPGDDEPATSGLTSFDQCSRGSAALVLPFLPMPEVGPALPADAAKGDQTHPDDACERDNRDEGEVTAHADLRVWSAGCASGEEPYTIAVLLLDTLGDGAGKRARIDATDIDRLGLERTQQAKYPEAAFSEMPVSLRRRYFREDQPLALVRDLVDIRAHDLMREAPPHPPYELIVCRNVVIYFERQAQERLFRVFVDALVPGGVLLLGKVETLFGPARERLTLADPRERIYTKPK